MLRNTIALRSFIRTQSTRPYPVNVEAVYYAPLKLPIKYGDLVADIQLRSYDNSSVQYNSDSSEKSSLSQLTCNSSIIQQPENGIVSNDAYNKMANSRYSLKTRKQRTDPRNTLSDEEDLEQRRKYICKICARGFTTSGHLARHNRIHTGEKNHCCPYKGCTQRFSRHDNCLQHYRTHLKKGQ